MKNKKTLLLIFTILSISQIAKASDHNFFFSLGAGLEFRQFDNPNIKKRLSQGGGGLLFDIGYRWEKIELILHTDYTGGHVEKMNFELENEIAKGRFWYGSISLAPILKYHFSNHADKKWNPFLLAGPIYKWTEFSGDNASSAQNHYRDVEVETHGLGGIVGLGVSRNTSNAYIDRMFYQLTYKQMDYRRMNSSWEIDGASDSKNTRPKDFSDKSISLNVGMTFSDKLFTWASTTSEKIVKVF